MKTKQNTEFQNSHENLKGKVLIPWEDRNTYVRLKTPTEFSFDEVLVYLTRSPNECLYHVEDKQVYKIIPIQGELLLIYVGYTADGFVEIKFPGASNPSQEMRLGAAQYVWEWFDLGTDLRTFYHMGQKDPLLHDLIHRFYGLRIVGVIDLFEALCWAITGQQINLKFAYTLKRRFIESFGKSVEREDRIYWMFPEPADIANLSQRDITSLQFTEKKSQYLIDVAGRMASGALAKEKLLDLNDFGAAEKALTAIRGIGPWTANYVSMRCLRNPDAFPVGDVALQNAVKQQLGLDQKPTQEELRTLGTRFGGWAAYATFYLWRSLQGLSA